jgi:MFS family permease
MCNVRAQSVMRRMRRSDYKSYLLNVLLVILAFNYLDRSVLALALQDIKFSLGLSDTQLGLLSGLAFALFYSVMGIPIARWADRGNRVMIIAITTALWSAAVALCGIAGSFLQLLLIRVGVAVGEAGCVPPAHSLIADHFSRAERPRAVAIYMLGSPLSIVVGYFLAGWLNELYGWRATFIIFGLPGLALAALAWFTLKDPRLVMQTAEPARPFAPTSLSAPELTTLPTTPSLKEVRAFLWSNVTFRHLLFCFSILSFFSQAIWQWQPTYFVRKYGLQPGELGTWFAISVGLPALLGTVLGGELASRFAAHNERLQLKAMAAAYISFGIASACVYLSSNRYMAFVFVALAALGGATASGPFFATVHTVVPQRMRAVSIATMYLFSNLIGMGLGPLAAGALSDALRPLFGDESLRYALLGLCPGFVGCGWHLWRASQTVARDVDETARANPGMGCQEDPVAPSSSIGSSPV